jgi:maleate isomerase
MAGLSPETILDWARGAIDPRADACLISCTAIKSAPVIAELERISGIPVLTSNQSMAWHLMRSNGIDSGGADYGRLFSTGPAAKGAQPEPIAADR